jgi:hypothetical protein
MSHNNHIFSSLDMKYFVHEVKQCFPKKPLLNGRINLKVMLLTNELKIETLILHKFCIGYL